MPKTFAHSHPQFPEDTKHWEPLFSEDCPTLHGAECAKCENLDPAHGHLNKVAYLAGKFAAEMFPTGSEESQISVQWGRLAGWWHDLGKFSPEWQEYLRKKADPHQDDISGKVDHSTAGAQYAVRTHPLYGQLLAFAIAGHHSGLLDTIRNGRSCQEQRLLKNDLPKISEIPASLKKLTPPSFPNFLLKAIREDRNSFSGPFFTRMLFSCLVDADFLATEAFMTPASTSIRNNTPDDALEQIADRVAAKIQSFGQPAVDDIVNQQRAKVAHDCASAANQPPGLFTLTVPTGGGKTLSSLHFALKHALLNGQKRVIYVVPFTSIIEQNAEVIRGIVSDLQSDTFTPLIEHHSSLSPDKDTEQSRLASENWDAPIIITTAVQFFESLFASKTSQARKLHNIANAIIILDEAQTLPVNYLRPCLRTLQEFSEHYNTTAVLCTATQPAIHYHKDDFPIGLRSSREIIQDPESLFDALKRVELEEIGECSDKELAKRLLQTDQALCIVNRRRHAQELFQLLPKSADAYHLSALMCPEHRSRILEQVRKRLRQRQPVRLISTQLIEAGVDVDFPFVYRALAGLDSIAQAAGRCNRNGQLPKLGKTSIFRPENDKAESYFRETAQIAAQVIEQHDDLLSESAIHQYFDHYYYKQKERWDEKDILGNFRYDGRPSLKHCPFRYQFGTAAKDFKLINDWQVPVIIPYDDTAREWIHQLRNESIPLHRNLLRGLQRYTVQISPKLLRENTTAFEAVRDDQFHVLISPELNYSPEFGLTLDEAHASSQCLIT